MAFLDRIHFYIPGWEIPKMRVEFFTDHYGFVVDYLAEALRELRQAQLHRDHRPPLLARLAPERPRREGGPQDGLGAGQAGLSRTARSPKEELAELVELALEGRRRVKEQLKKMGSFEYHQTSFSLHRQRDPRGAVRRRARAGRAGHDLDRPAGPRLGLRRLGGRPGQGRALPAGSRLLAGDREAEDRRRGRGADEGVDPAGVRLPPGPEGARWGSPSRWTRPTSTSRRSTC